MAVMFRLHVFLSEFAMTLFAGCSHSVLHLLLRGLSLHRLRIRWDASDVVVLISDVFEEDGHRVFSAVDKYFAVKLWYMGDTKAGEAARLVELTYLCVRSALYIFFRRYQEDLKVGV